MRLFSPRKCFLLIIIIGTLVVTIIHFLIASKGTTPERRAHSSSVVSEGGLVNAFDNLIRGDDDHQQLYAPEEAAGACTDAAAPPIFEKIPRMDTVEIFPTLDFNASWIPRRKYWNEKMEKRYKKVRQETWGKLPLKVVLMPHSHNDPGWITTFESYFDGDTKLILDGAVDKMMKYKNLTMVWTEISFLSLWWEKALVTRQDNLRLLVKEGRFEILTGGWVMTDEANVHLFAMVDQMIEGHQWVLNTFGVRPRSSWSVDPFGHGGTFPYILKSSGVDNMVIMRIHYAWKEYFAQHQAGSFLWEQRWDSSGKSSILCHNFPYDIYSVKGTCGPFSDVCIQYNFGILGSALNYGEYSRATEAINTSNLVQKAEQLLDQYGRTGSLFSHNVVLVPIGEDFMYREKTMYDTMYSNYKALADYINDNSDRYHADVRFGTLSDYFDAVNERTTSGSFLTLSGDFFVYADVFTSGTPAYWSGYFSTRPYMKQLSREVEHHLRSAEILFSLAFQRVRKSVEDGDGDSETLDHFAEMYGKELTLSRRYLGLFQHHDAITGTCTQRVMNDYGAKLYEALIASNAVQKETLKFLMDSPDDGLLEDAFERDGYADRPRPLPVDVKSGDGEVVVFNSLLNDRYEAVKFFLDDSRVVDDLCIEDPHHDGGNEGKRFLDYQVNPTWTVAGGSKLHTKFVEVVFIGKLWRLSVTRFRVFVCSDEMSVPEAKALRNELRHVTKVYCENCVRNGGAASTVDLIEIKKLPKDKVIRLENEHLLVDFDYSTRLLKGVRDKTTADGKTKSFKMTLAGYPTKIMKNGVYLFAPLDEETEIFGAKDIAETVVVTGRVYSEISVLFVNGPEGSGGRTKLVHTVRLYHCPGQCSLSRGMYVENTFGFGSPKNQDMDVFMRLNVSDIENGKLFYTDQNGFQMQKRERFAGLGLEANVYPVTSTMYIEDKYKRLTLLVDHAAASTSRTPGSLEVIMDRRATLDDWRGMGEGLMDDLTTTHRYWILYETVPQASTAVGGGRLLSTPTTLANFLSRKLNYPATLFRHKVAGSRRKSTPHKGAGDRVTRLLNSPSPDERVPCDTHLFNLRTLSKSLGSAPLTCAGGHVHAGCDVLLILQRQSSNDCSTDLRHARNSTSPAFGCDAPFSYRKKGQGLDLDFARLSLVNMTLSTLTGNADVKSSTTLEKANFNWLSLDQMELRSWLLRFE